MGNSPADENKDLETTRGQGDQGQPGDLQTQEFVSTQIDENAENSTDWWSESTDGQCSENAALFAASQPAPLSIV